MKTTIWIDLDNSPHVLLFKPIIQELEKRNFSILVTARDAFQVKDLLAQMNVTARLVGHHNGKHSFLKLMGLFQRAMQLLPIVWKNKPDLALSHGSRAQMILAKLLDIKTILILDYEFVTLLPFFLPDYLIMPALVAGERFHAKGIKILHYPGIKEDVYLPFFTPNATVLAQLGVCDETKTIITIREPATEAHYFVPESEAIFESVMDHLSAREDVTLVLLPRSGKRADFIKARWAGPFNEKKLILPEHAVDGLSLLWHSDLVISGGGTMNREAATLGVPVYTIFQGQTGAVDRYLSAQGRLTFIKTHNDIKTKIKIKKRIKGSFQSDGISAALIAILKWIQQIQDETLGRKKPIQVPLAKPKLGMKITK